jgi:hypothetical protein
LFFFEPTSHGPQPKYRSYITLARLIFSHCNTYHRKRGPWTLHRHSTAAAAAGFEHAAHAALTHAAMPPAPPGRQSLPSAAQHPIIASSHTRASTSSARCLSVALSSILAPHSLPLCLPRYAMLQPRVPSAIRTPHPARCRYSLRPLHVADPPAPCQPAQGPPTLAMRS